LANGNKSNAEVIFSEASLDTETKELEYFSDNGDCVQEPTGDYAQETDDATNEIAQNISVQEPGDNIFFN
jgi:hypothetical protein